MSTEPHADLALPASSTPASSSRRGGRRPGAGAPKGNLNAFKHGRRSRFKDLVHHDTSAVVRAGRLLARDRRAVERHASALMRLALIARHRRVYVQALEQGQRLPQPPLLDLTDLDVGPLLAWMERLAVHARAERARAAGDLTTASASVASARAFADEIERFLGVATARLDAALAALSAPPP